MQAEWLDGDGPPDRPVPSLPRATVHVSAQDGTGIEELRAALHALLAAADAGGA